MIEHSLSWFRESGVERAAICANGDTVALREQLGAGHNLGIELDYFEDRMPRGPAGGVRDACAGHGARRVVVVEGSVIPRLDMGDLLHRHDADGAALTVVVSRGAGGARDGAPEPLGIYVFSADALTHVPARGYQDIKEGLIPRLHAYGERIRSYPVDPWAAPRIRGMSSYMATCKWLLERMLRDETLPAGYEPRGEALVHVSARVEPTAKLVGPVLIGPGCQVGAGAVLIGPSSLGDGCRIGAGATISRSVFWSRCEVSAGAVVNHCLVTDGATVGAGAAVADTICLAEPPRRSILLERLSSFFQFRSGGVKARRAGAGVAGGSTVRAPEPVAPAFGATRAGEA